MARTTSTTVLRAKRIARELREEFRCQGEFRQQDFRDHLAGRLEDFRQESYEGFIDHIAKTIDDESVRETLEEQPALFDMGGEFRLGEGRRVARSLARIEHADEWLAQDEQNLAAVARASARKHEMVGLLRPFWNQGMTMAQAVGAYNSSLLSEAGN